ncbi:MAG: T9SS type A sorting domain-containing protein [Bacteroidetes bacterium]|nr:MAG: T9SS type A sorting domain-containing protein [Bacteroidota bacterium]
MKKVFIGVLLMPFLIETAYSQLLINEICPANITVIQNSTGNYFDYIELYNAGTAPLNISGFALNDEPIVESESILPDYVLAAGSRLLIYASGSNDVDVVDHYEMPVDAYQSWRYMVGSAALDPNWRELNFDDSQWSLGNGGIGYGDGDDATVVSQEISVMMRKTFTITDSASILEAILMMDFDDGFKAYLNGVEIASVNMWSGNLDWDIWAKDAHEAQIYQGLPPDSFYIDKDLLKSLLINGKNVLAIQTHNVEPNSSDLSSIPFLIFGTKDSAYNFPAPPTWFRSPDNSSLYVKFKLGRNGESIYLFDPNGNIIDQQVYPPLESDHSYQRSYDGAGSWSVSYSPTPAASNNSFACYTGYTLNPLFSIDGGFYPSTQSLAITTAQIGGIIRYTSNGDIPTATDSILSSTINISSSSTIRARVFASGYLPGKTVTHTFLINEVSKLPVFALTTDSLNLWDENTGIYVLGPNADSLWPHFGANFWQEWKKPVTVEYYDRSKQNVLNFNAGFEIYGNYSRAKAQKSFEIHLEDQYGLHDIHYPLINDKSWISEYENIVLRNSGTDWNVVHFRDAMMQRIMKNTHSSYLAAESVRVFLNGKDWGVYNVHEKNNHKWVETNYDLKKSEFSFLSEQGSKITAENGTADEFWKLYEYATTEAQDSTKYYEYINQHLDLKNYADYFIAETYYDNGDWIGEWTNNIKMWKPNKEGSRWKYLLLDLDFGLGLFGNTQENRLEMARNPMANSNSSNMFDAILKNPIFKRYFINRYADLINTIYLPSSINAVMHQFKDSMETDMKYHFNKWGSDSATWNNNIASMMSYVAQRPSFMRSVLNNDFSLAGEVTLTLNTVPAGSGRIEINTITPLSYPWNGVYFNGNPVTITAIPNPGYSFDHWTAGNINTNAGADQLTVNFTGNDQITAHFTGSDEDPLINISEFNYHSDSTFDSGDWIELFNYGSSEIDLSGWKFRDEEENHVFTIPTGTKIPSNSYLVLSEDTSRFDLIYPDVRNRIGQFEFSLNNSGDEIHLYNYIDEPYISFAYETSQPWPVEADGDGYTCELKSNQTYHADGNNWQIGCFGGSPGKAKDNNLSIAINIIGENYFCKNSSNLLSTNEIADATYQWKLNGINIGSAITPSYNVDEEASYQVRVQVKSCSGISAPVDISQAPLSIEPIVKNGNRCGNGQVLLQASSNELIQWYDAPGGNLIGSGNKFATPSISQTTKYYALSGGRCPSKSVEVLASINNACESPVMAFPNPSNSSTVNVLLDNSYQTGKILVSIVDCMGRIVQSKEEDLSELQTLLEINTGNLSQGIYSLSVRQGDNYNATKLLRQK